MGQRHPSRLVDGLDAVGLGGRRDDPVDEREGAVEIAVVDALDVQRDRSVDATGSTDETACSLAGSTKR